MKSLRPHHVSLYELALGDAQAPPLLQVSPTTFKSMLGSFLDLLIDRQIPATLWLKLPQGEVWTAEIERYRAAATASYTLYLLGSTVSSVADEAVMAEEIEMAEVEMAEVEMAEIEMAERAVVDIAELPIATASKTIRLPLSADAPLRREYLLQIVSPDFCGLLVAHRPRPVRQQAGSTPPPGSPPGSNLNAKGSQPEASKAEASKAEARKAEASAEDDLERRHPLNALCSFDLQAMQRVLTGISGAILGEPSESSFNPTYTTLNGLVNHWQVLVSECAGSPLKPDILSYLFTKQVQTQEEIWHSTALHRRQAEVATLLQMENEEFQNAIRLKDEFLTTVGQELRSPLATMKTALSLLNSSSLKPAQRQRYLDMLTHECDRQSSLITSVLDLLQLEKVDDRIPAQPLRLQSVVPGIVSTYQPLAQEKGIVMAYLIPDELAAVACTASWLRQIMINLLHNGIKFTQSGGRVWITAKPQGDYVQVDVRDTGVGIPQSDIPKVFDRFYRIRPGTNDVSGSGLGLSIVQQLLLRCGGSISVKSRLGEGSTFSVLLPVFR